MQLLLVVGLSLIMASLGLKNLFKSARVARLSTRCFATSPPMTKEMLREEFEVKNASSLFLLDATKFGLDVSLADGTTLKHCDTIILLFCDTVTFKYSHTLTLSHSLILTHSLTL
jgi:hypothetical protein